MNILILCTGNSCRSQIAEAWLKVINPNLNVHSAGTNPEKSINPLAIATLKELDIDISTQKPKDITPFLSKDWDYIITLCNNAKETCPIFSSKAKNVLHYPIEDASKTEGSMEERMKAMRKMSLEINHLFFFLNENVFGKDGIICTNKECDKFNNPQV